MTRHHQLFNHTTNLPSQGYADRFALAFPFLRPRCRRHTEFQQTLRAADQLPLVC